MRGSDERIIRETITCDEGGFYERRVNILNEESSLFYTTDQSFKILANWREVGKFNFIDKEIAIYGYTSYKKSTNDCDSNYSFPPEKYDSPITINASYQKVQGFNFNLTN